MGIDIDVIELIERKRLDSTVICSECLYNDALRRYGNGSQYKEVRNAALKEHGLTR